MPRALAHLTSADCSVVISIDGDAPSILHWGARISDSAADELVRTAATGVPTGAPDTPRTPSIVPVPSEGWAGNPGFTGHTAGRALPVSWTPAAVDHDRGRAIFELVDSAIGLRISMRFALDAHGVLSASAAAVNVSDRPEVLDLAALRLMMPLPSRASEVLDFTGRWSGERAPQRRPLLHGGVTRRADRGRPAHDTPFLMAVGTAGFGFRSGEVWAAHLAWSGASEYLVDRLPEGAGAAASMLGVAESLAPGEIRLAPGERYETPRAVFAWSDQGLDGVTAALHAHVRDRAAHPATPRPVTVNSWEAVYFDQSPEALDELVTRAARIGAERFVLDDGWFRGRDDDTSSLGDWEVDDRKWPAGLLPLSRRVHELGMQFGLWVEPEMVNLDSELARAHPDWLLAPSHRAGATARHQHVLNVAHPDAARHLLRRLSTLITENDVDYLKWDHNRDLIDAVDRTTGAPGVHRQTEAVYALLDALQAKHPTLEIEACAAGGARVDLGMLSRTHRIWTSDTLDPVERQRIQLWTATVVPPELMGTHVGADRAHTTGRRTDLSFRLATALVGHVGVEWDLASCSDEDLDALGAWVVLAKDVRELVARGRTARADLDDRETMLTAIVEPDGSRALVSWVRLGTSPETQTGRIPIPGLRADTRYRVRLCTELGLPRFADRVPPPCVAEAAADRLVLSGEVLGSVGLPWPSLQPAQAAVFELRETP
jgi:alpha-galactosidase